MEYQQLFVRAGDQTLEAKQAEKLFCEELQTRSVRVDEQASGGVVFVKHAFDTPDEYEIQIDGAVMTVLAAGLRGMIYGFSTILRKSECINGTLRLICDMARHYRPAKRFRGHQLGYRPKNNTYDAWSPAQFERYYRDMMYFNANIVELMPGETDDRERNELMQYGENEMMYRCAELADRVDLDVSVWYPNCDGGTPESAAERRVEVLTPMKRLNYLFPPGGDPGDYPAEEFLERAVLTERAVKKIHPAVQMWPSAQQPHGMPDWGERFAAVLKNEPTESAGVITGPNRAFDIEELRRRLPMRYPIRFYPDITHNVRCEHPVHFMEDDWHYAWASTMGRESINPRPVEYAELHRQLERYIDGGVSYSEGCNDDINKMVWGWLDYAPETPVREILEDYARVFFPGADASMAADGILALEKNWVGDPAENPMIEGTLALWESLAAANPHLKRNWRWASCLFRAKGDALVRRRRLFEQQLCRTARRQMAAGNVAAAIQTLETAPDDAYHTLRAELFDLAVILFETNGMQLDLAHFHAAGAERGATLETIDLPVTDRAYYLKRLRMIRQLPDERQAEAAKALIAHETVRPDEYVFSVSEDTMRRFGGKPKDAYLNFRGDKQDQNDGSLPMSLLGLYDHYFFRAELGGFLLGQDYELKLILSDRRRNPMPETELLITGNGKEIYRGPAVGGRPDPAYDEAWLAGRYVSRTFRIPADVFENGCLNLFMEEKKVGVEFAELRILRAESNQQ